MNKFYIIVDEGQSIKTLTCTDIDVESTCETVYGTNLGLRSQINFTARNVEICSSNNAFNLPSTLWCSLQNNCEQNIVELNEKQQCLKEQIDSYEKQLDLIQRLIDLCHDKVGEIFYEHPQVAEEVRSKLEELEDACFRKRDEGISNVST